VVEELFDLSKFQNELNLKGEYKYRVPNSDNKVKSGFLPPIKVD
jgi:hypothetical protein